jgi:hypothetical protein
MVNTETEAYGYRVVNGANGDVIAIYPGDLDGGIAASRLAQASNDQESIKGEIGQHYSERFNY